MKIHEYQAKQLLRAHGVAVPRGHLALTPTEAEGAFRQLGGPVAVVKAQIHAGGRGKGGGVKLARSADEARELARAMLGMSLVTKQTGPEGQKVRKLYVEEGQKIARELYLAVLLDRETGRVTMIASADGGMEIEEVAARTPERILKVAVDPVTGLVPHQARRLAFSLGLDAGQVPSFVRFATALYGAYLATDASLVEVNPLAVIDDGAVVALDAKMVFDDNAIYRRPEVAALRDPDEEDPRESRAKEHDLQYIALDGNIGCMVNGAGLAMATMDIIRLAGGTPANFLDVGGGADEAKVKEAFKLLLADANVKAVLVNIFGGIMKCDTIAEGVISAVKQVGLKVPLVVRLEGTNVELGKKMLADSGLPITTAGDMADGAQKIVALVKGAK